MFDVQNVNLSFGEREILKDASFKVEDGERAAIIGPNGMGKSTLLKIIAGVQRPEKGVVAFPKTSEIGYLPQDLELLSTRSVLDECKTVFDEVLAHEAEMRELEDKMTVVPHDSEEFERIADRYEYLLHETQRRDLYSMDSTIGKILSGLGFKPKDLERPCNTFSGGWQMRILLAKLLLQNPDILLLDEPTNHLDIESIEWLAEWIKTHEGSVLMVSHERAFMDALVTKVLEVDRGVVTVYRGTYTEALDKRRERREMQQRAFDNQQRELAHHQKFVDRFRAKASKATLVQSRIKQMDKIEVLEAPSAELDTISFRFPPAPRGAKEALVAEGITKAFGPIKVLNNVSVSIYRGEKVALVGVNGAGKTTLMRVLAGRDPEHQGSVKYGSNIDLAYFAQYDKEDLHPDNTVLGEFMSQAPLEVSGKARGILGAFLFSGDDVEKPIRVLSGGERTRLRLSRMLCGKANLLMLDEPTNHLDIGSRLTLEAALRQYDGSVILVSHDRYFLDNVVTRVIEIADGNATSYPGNYTEYLAMKEMREAANGKPVEPKKTAPSLSAGRADSKEEDRRQKQEEEKAAKHRLRKAQQELEQHEELLAKAEAQIDKLENEMASASEKGEYDKLAELTAKLETAQNKKSEIEDRWMALQEEVEGLTAVIG